MVPMPWLPTAGPAPAAPIWLLDGKPPALSPDLTLLGDRVPPHNPSKTSAASAARKPAAVSAAEAEAFKAAGRAAVAEACLEAPASLPALILDV